GGAGAALANSHAKHVTVAADCGKCHATTSTTGTDITGAAHLDGALTVSLGASYDTNGATANYDGTLNNKTCTATYCHGAATGLKWGGTIADTAECDSCHGGNKTATATTGLGAITAGKHTAHIANADPELATFACGRCHSATVTTGNDRSVTGGANHVNLTKNVAYDTLNPAGTAGTCNSLYCHSNGKGTYINQTLATAWVSGAAIGCKGCHGTTSTYGQPDYANGGAGAALANSHATHVSVAADCGKCHATTSTTGTDITGAGHLDGALTVSLGAAYDTNGATANYDGTLNNKTCSATTCHGSGIPKWGGTLYSAVQCEKCHGSAAIGPFYSTSYPTQVTVATDTKVGAHNNHLRANQVTSGGHKYSSDIACAECHTVPASVNAAGHMDTALPAELTFGTLAKTGGLIPAFNTTSRQCSNTYCHGATITGGTNKTPTWNVAYLNGTSADCGSCHGNPPATAGHTGVAADQCNACHPHVNNNRTFNDVTKHINGALDGGISGGGQACYGCHGAYQTAMEDGAGTKTGATRASYYHHVLGGASGDGDIAPNAGTYPTSTTDVYCVSCHTDHNYFNASKGANLRSGIAAAGSSTAASDFSATAPNGICVSCHSASQTKDTTNQKSDGTTVTPAINGTTYAASMHNYTSSSLFGASKFDANCSKCHTDEQAKDKQTSVSKFGTHYSAPRSLLNPLGATVTDPQEERFCFRCHSVTTDNIGGTKKAVNNKDYFGSTAMTAASENIFQAFTTNTRVYRHNVNKYSAKHKIGETRADIAANKHVECADCHDPHQAKQGTHTKGSGTLANVLTGAAGVGVTTWGANWAGVTTYNPSTTTGALITVTAEWQICFKCHSAANANYATWGGTGAGAWTDMGLEFNPNNQSYHPVIQALPSTGNRRLASTALTGGWTPGQVMNCSDCHGTDSATSKGPHGSNVKWMLNPNTTATKYYNWPYTTAAGNGQSTGTLVTGTGTATVPVANFCFSCHVWSGGGQAHTGRSDHAVTCVGCHIRVPHGGKALRLLTGPNAPARYKPNGNAGGTTYLNGGSRPASGTMGETNCQTSGGCNAHTATGTLLGW
ncbi:MAG: cytochrome c family, partial [Geobacteraceae bacterium]